MLTYYYFPGACSTASHIGLEESGARYERKTVDLLSHEQMTPEYRKVNPRGKVPVLRLEDGSTLVENTAILFYLAHRYPEKHLLPPDYTAQARCISMMTWLSSAVHPPFTHIRRPERFTEDPAGIPAIQAMGRKTFWTQLEELDAMIAGKAWMQGDHFTMCDPYALVFYGWGVRIELPVQQLIHLTAWKDRMIARPTVRRILELEKNVLVQAA